MADRNNMNTSQGTGGDPSVQAPSTPKPSLRQRAWTMLGGKTLEEASAADLTRAGIGIRPMRKATQEVNTQHSAELHAQLEKKRSRRAALRLLMIVGGAMAIVYLLSTRL